LSLAKLISGFLQQVTAARAANPGEAESSFDVACGGVLCPSAFGKAHIRPYSSNYLNAFHRAAVLVDDPSIKIQRFVILRPHPHLHLPKLGITPSAEKGDCENQKAPLHCLPNVDYTAISGSSNPTIICSEIGWITECLVKTSAAPCSQNISLTAVYSILREIDTS